MSELYDPKFTRHKTGNYSVNKGLTSVVAGTDAYFLEDEANEMQAIQNEARAEILRNKYYSGIYSGGNKFYTDNSMIPNFFAFEKMTALLNGHLLEVSGNNGYYAINNQKEIINDKDINNIFLPEPPEKGIRYDFVYLEFWFSELKWDSDIWTNGNYMNYQGLLKNDIFDKRINGETCRRVQLQWAIRVIPTLDTVDTFKNVIFDETELAKYIPAIGGMTNNSIYGFIRSDKNSNINLNDKGLWVAGKGNIGEMNTVDGYSYAIPLFKVLRRNIAPYSADNVYGGSLYNSSNITYSDRPDGKFSNIVCEDDIIDLRNFIRKDYNSILESNFKKLLTGEFSTSELTSTYFGLENIVADSTTLLYCGFNKTLNFNSINPSVINSYTYVPGVEQEAIRFDDNNSIEYKLNPTGNKFCTQMIIKLDGLENRDLFSFKKNNIEVLSCFIKDYKLNVKGLNNLISIDVYILSDLLNFNHLAVTWSKEKNNLALVFNGNTLIDVDITSELASNFDYFILGKTSNNFGSKNTIFDELEIGSRYTASYFQLPKDFISGHANLAIDMQYGRSNYKKCSNTSKITKHITSLASSAGVVNFTITPDTSVLVNGTYKIYFDNEAVEVPNTNVTVNNNKLLFTITGLGANITYNFVVIFDVTFKEDQGFTNLPKKMYQAKGEEIADIFNPVRTDRFYEEQVINQSFGNYIDKLIVFNSKLDTKLGFSTGLKIYLKCTGNALSIPLNLYNYNIISVYSAKLVSDINNTNLISNVTKTNKFNITLNKNLNDELLEIIVATPNPSIIYDYLGGGIDNLCRSEKLEFIGDGYTKEFTYRSESKILTSLGIKLNNDKNYICFVDGKLTIVDIEFIDTFIKIKFNTAPANKSNILLYITSEYIVNRSERFTCWYEALKYTKNKLNDVMKFNDKKLVYHNNKILAMTEGINKAVETRPNKVMINTAYLPITENIDSKIIPTKLFKTATNIYIDINFVEMNDNDNNNSLAILETVNLNVKENKSGRGFIGLVSIDNKSLYNNLSINNAHLNVFPVLVEDDNTLKMLVLTTYNENDIVISGNLNESAVDVFELDRKYLIKHL